MARALLFGEKTVETCEYENNSAYAQSHVVNGHNYMARALLGTQAFESCVEQNHQAHFVDSLWLLAAIRHITRFLSRYSSWMAQLHAHESLEILVWLVQQKPDLDM